MPGVPKPTQIPDSEILSWIRSGLLVFRDSLTPDPQLYFRGRLLKPQLNEQSGRRRIHGSARWRFHLRYEGRQRMIVRAKLVAMFFFGEVGEDDRVHHGEGGRLDDGILNIDVWTNAEHDAYHYDGDF